MALATEERVIGDHAYRVTQLTALKGRALFARLVQFLGPAVATAVGSGNVRDLLNLDVGTLVAMLSEKFTEAELDYFCSTLMSCTELVGEGGATVKLDKALFDIHFGGRLLEMFKWLAFALEVQFSDFLSVARATLAAASAAKGSRAPKSHDHSTGTSGGS